MSQAQIELALFDKLEAIKASLPTIYYPNSPNKNKPNPPTGEHIRVSVLNAGTNAIGIATTDQTLGIMQCLVLVKTAQAQLEPHRLQI